MGAREFADAQAPSTTATQLIKRLASMELEVSIVADQA
jgi:hypothetical protein